MDLLSDLNEAQKKAVTHVGGPLLIVAGAGTGKTTVVTRRFAWLVQQSLAAQDRILTLTFTEKAASEMEERIDQILPLSATERWVMTFHAFCERVLRTHAIDIGLPGDFKILNTTGAWLLLRRNLHKFSLEYYKPLGNPAKFLRVLLDHFSRLHDEAVSPAEYMAYVQGETLNADTLTPAPLPKGEGKGNGAQELARMSEVANAYHTYQQIKLDSGLFDFGDLMMYTYELFKRRPAVLALWRTQFPYILVDEFQDTNWVQYEVMKMLTFPYNNVTVCGDDEQSIYAFRGASMSNILHFKDDYPSATQVVLTQNYRSLQEILDSAYQFIQANNPDRLEYTLKIPKKLVASREGSATIAHLHAPSLSEEVKLVIDTILELRRNDTTIALSDIAILVRANSHAESCIPALEAAGIPYRFLASSGLYAKPVVLDIIAYLKLLDNYHESAALYRILTLPSFALPHEDVALLTHYAKRKGTSLYSALKAASVVGISAAARTKVDYLLHSLAVHSTEQRQGAVPAIIFQFLEKFGILKSISPQAESGNLAAILSLTALQQFLKKVEELCEAEPNPSVHTIMATFDLLLKAGDEGSMASMANEGPDVVHLMTVHGAKGLEFRYVFIMNMVDLRFPSMERKDPLPLPNALVKELIPQGDVHLQEERRLLYVAMTRARDGLFFTSAQDYGGLRKKKLSRFLVEMGYGKREVTKPTGKVDFHDLNPKSQILNSKQIPNSNDSNSKQLPNYPITQLPHTFSFTQLKAFQACPLQYKFAHILMVPVPGKPSFSFGKSIHATLEKFLSEHTDATKMQQASLFTSPPPPSLFPPLTHLLDLYEQSWIADWYEDEVSQEKYKEKGTKMLTTWYEGMHGHFPPTLMCEAPFKIKVGPYTLKGVIDRIDRAPSPCPLPKGEGLGEGVTIIDYKTGATPEAREVDKDQLLLYHMAAREVWGLTPVSLEYHYLESDTNIAFTGTNKDITLLREKIVTTIDAMQQSDFKATPSSYTCRSCDFNSICEYRML